METLASVLEKRRLLLWGGGFEGHFGEEMVSACGEPCLGYAGAGAERDRIVVQVVDDVVY
jgi:hypothetical protein